MATLNYSDLYVELKTGPYAHTKPVDRFWSKVHRTRTGCWEWTGKKATNDYGLFVVRGQSFLAHRVAYFIANGGLEDAMCVCHKCDNRLCVKPDHLFLGTQKDNMVDMVSKGRDNPAKGLKAARAKLGWQTVLTIRGLHKQGKTQKELAETFNVTPKQISVIVNEKQWKFDLDAFQTLCMETAIYPDVGDNLTYPVLGFVGEAGEVANKYKKILRGDSELTEQRKQQLTDELGDCLYYLAAVAFELGVSFSELAALNLDKLRSRAARGVLKGDGDTR